METPVVCFLIELFPPTAFAQERMKCFTLSIQSFQQLDVVNVEGQ
jgi:hypothetical protein